jgi:NAD(P)-dependent dehydrogenase (short-subunit alcohol dehydrogenase family)
VNVAGKRVVLTGGSSGIGFELARQLSAKGARLLLTGRNPAKLADAVERLRVKGIEVHGLAGDVTDAEAREALLAESERLFGGTDMLVNNAGGVRAGRLEDISEAELRMMIESIC